MDADLDKIVVGQIDKIEKHPDADKLIICQVNIGTETHSDRNRCSECKRRRQSAGCSGRRTCSRRSRAWTSTLPAESRLKKANFAECELNGMMCSIEELGSNRDMYPEAPEYGIYIFHERCRSREQMQYKCTGTG